MKNNKLLTIFVAINFALTPLLVALSPLKVAQVQDRSTIHTASGSINEVSIKIDEDGGAVRQIYGDFNAYTFAWPRGTTFQYSWGGEYFEQPEEMIDEQEQGDIVYSEMSHVVPETKILYIRMSTALEIKLITFNTEDLTQVAILGDGTNTISPANGGIVNYDTGVDYSELQIVNRKGWGADETLLQWPPEYHPVDKVVVHHTVWTRSDGNYAAVVRAMYLYHSVTHGWGDIGYNYIIDPDGKIYEGRAGGAGVVGAHAYGHNYGSIGISLIGNYEKGVPSQAALDSLQKLMTERSLLHGIALEWKANVYGHKDFSVTSCPGKNLYVKLPSITGGAEAERVTQSTTTALGVARTESEAKLLGYGDSRLKLNFSAEALADSGVVSLIPKYGGIDRIVKTGTNFAELHIDGTSYAGGYKNHLNDRQNVLNTIFALDKNVDSIELYNSPGVIGLTPENGKFYTKQDSLYLTFSKKVQKGNGLISLHSVADGSVVTSVDMQSVDVNLLSGNRVSVKIGNVLDEGKSYFVKVCGTCIIDQGTPPVPFPGITDNQGWKFRVNPPQFEMIDIDGDSKSDIVKSDANNNLFLDYGGNWFGKWDQVLLNFGFPGVKSVPGDYDGDGIDDISLRTKTGIWEIDYSANGFGKWDFRGSGYAGRYAIETPADYDGDGKTDLSARTISGTWHIDYSENGFGKWDKSLTGRGGRYTNPVIADYDGDGKADISFRRRKDGLWRIDYSSTGFGWDKTLKWYGGKYARETVADYDGDGKDDISYRTLNGNWFIDYARNGFGRRDVVRRRYGGKYARPVSADYDGDGKADLSVRTSSGTWAIDYARDGFRGWNFARKGYGGSIAVNTPADYDGDGKVDIAVRTAGGTWMIDYAANGFRGVEKRINDKQVRYIQHSQADYDGDGKVDIAVFDKEGYWVFDMAADGFNGVDKVVGGYGGSVRFADYDGDGKDDLSAMFGRGMLVIDYAVNGFVGWEEIQNYGRFNSKLVSADFDGDKKDDVAEYSADGGWRIDFASNGFRAWEKQVKILPRGAVPQVADYDGDRKADIAVKTNYGEWIIDYSGNGLGSRDVYVTGYGGSYYLPSALDYDGDRKADLMVKSWRGELKIDYAKNGYGKFDEVKLGYGRGRITLLPGDYDGDSVADPAILDGNYWMVDYSFDGFDGWDSGVRLGR